MDMLSEYEKELEEKEIRRLTLEKLRREKFGGKAKVPAENSPPSEKIGIRGLFSLSGKPPAVFYKGSRREGKGRGWVKTRGKTQTFAILELAAEKYRRNSKKGTTPEKIVLSLVEIEKCFKDPKRCNRPPDLEATYTPKRHLDLLKKNILQIAPFTNEELVVNERDNTAFLSFFPHK